MPTKKNPQGHRKPQSVNQGKGAQGGKDGGKHGPPVPDGK